MIPISSLDADHSFERGLVSALGQRVFFGGQRTERVACHYNWHYGWFRVCVVMRCGVQFHFNASTEVSVQDAVEHFGEYADNKLKEWLTPHQSV